MPKKTIEELRDEYASTLQAHEEAIAALRKRSSRISWMRLTVFLFGLAASYFLARLETAAGIAFLVLVIGVFLFLVRRHAQLLRQTAHEERLASVNRAEMSALGGDYEGFADGADYDVPGHPYAHDLDIFGEESIFRILNRTVTRGGEARLARWLSEPLLDPELIRQRQQAVAELSDDISWRQEFQARGMAAEEGPEDLPALRRWMQEENLFFGKPWARWLIALNPLMVLGFVLLAVLGLINISQLILLLLLPLGIVARHLKKVNALHARLGRKAELLMKYSRLFELVSQREMSSVRLAWMKDEARGARGSLRELARILESLDSRLNLLMGLILNIVLVWDIRQVYRLEAWRARSDDRIDEWFRAIYHVDAIISLANFHYNSPGSVFPEPDLSGPLLESRELGHPGIPPNDRVSNPADVSDWGRFLIITGANMAGKSTYLRTVGVSLVLAMAGSAVHAAAFRFRPLHIIASIRTRDSLKSNESYFYAELKKLKFIIDELAEGPRFIILDEILKGTNSRDKQAGSQALVRQLVQLGASGLIATHDLQLGELQEELPGHVRNHCFEVQIKDDRLYFDYRLHEGIAQNLNASFLMRKMGITL